MGDRGQRWSEKVTSPPQTTFKELAIKVACVIRPHKTYIYINKVIDVLVMVISG